MSVTFRKECQRVKGAFQYVLRRSLLLCILGVLLANFSGLGAPYSLDKLRLPSALGRAGVAFFIVSCCLIFLPRARIRSTIAPSSPFLTAIPEVTLHASSWVFIMTIQMLHLGLVFFLPLKSGCPTGYLGPGGTADNGTYATCTGGSARLVDELILGLDHMGRSPFCVREYQCDKVDPCGLFGMMPTTLTVMLGVLAGNVFTLRKGLTAQAACVRLGVWALMLCGIGLVLHFTVLPINHTLWSTSFVLVTSAITFVLLALTFSLTQRFPDLPLGALRWAGTNPLALFLFSQLWVPVLRSVVFKSSDINASIYHYVFEQGFCQIGDDNVAQLLWALATLTAAIALSWWLYTHNVTLRF